MTSPRYSPHQMQSGTAIYGDPNMEDPVNLGDARAVPDLAEANAAVAAAGDSGENEYTAVQSVPNMSYPGTHRLGD